MMDRRDFLKLGLAAGTTCSTQSIPVLSRHGAAARRQAVIILGESVRYDMLNCNRSTGLKTPNLDRIAAGGVNFDRAYNCQPVCAPARSAIWTGLYPHSSGVWANSMPIGETEHTIGQRLTDQGVHCAFIGKWHLSGTDYFDTGIPAPGWDKNYWYDMRTYLQELSPADRVRSRKIATGKDPSWTKEMCYGYRCTQRALDFLEKHGNEDFLLVISYDEPHGPALCPLEYTQAHKDFAFPVDGNLNDPLANKPEEQRVWAGPRMDRDLTKASGWGSRAGNPQYFGAHAFIDHEIGRVLDSIEARAPGAMVLYTADHGVFLDAHRLTDKGPAMYQEITHVPFLVRWPGNAPAGVRSTSLLSHININPTLMEFFGFDVPRTMQGKSALAAFRNPAATINQEIFIEWGRYEIDHDMIGGYQPIRCVCDGRYKLAVNAMTTDELYDLQSDPLEMTNLIDSDAHASIRTDLHDRLLNWMNVSRDPFRGYYWGRRAWRPDFPVTWANAGFTRQRDDDGYLPRELDYDTGLTMTAASRPK
jgi:uncharacterized sulfatase